MVPSFQLILSLDIKYHINRLEIKENNTKSVNATILTVNDEKRRVTPRMQVRLINPLPMIFPKAKLR